jgi:hypothetical protein
MGYYVQIEEADFTVPRKNLEQADAALRALNTDPSVDKTGGLWGPGGKKAAWFAWMDEHYDDRAVCADLAAILRMLGFDLDSDEGGLHIIGYDSKTGQEDLFIERLAPYATEGSYLQWRGEEGERWRDTVREGRIERLHAQTTWA